VSKTIREKIRVAQKDYTYTDHTGEDMVIRKGEKYKEVTMVWFCEHSGRKRIVTLRSPLPPTPEEMKDWMLSNKGDSDA
jgi:hypothetical protein